MNQSTAKQAINALPPDADAKALAPVDETSEVNDSYKSLAENQDFAAHLNKIADHATAQSNSEAQWERRRKAVILRKYILGYFVGIFDKQKGFVSGKEEGDGIYFDPQTPTIIDDLVASLTKTKPQLKCGARSGDERIDKREAARVAEKLLQIDDEQDFTPKRQQREWKWNLLAAGETYRITYFNANKQGYGFDKDVWEPKTVNAGETAHLCALCGTTGSDEAGKCPNCGNPQLDEYSPVGATVSVKKGTKFEQVGDVDWDGPDALEMTVIGDTDNIDEALIVMRDRMIPRCVLADALGIDLNDFEDTPVPDSLRYKQMFANGSMQNSSGKEMPEFKMQHYQEFWVAPAVIANYPFPANTKTIGGKEYPNGAKGKDVFPNGFYFSRSGKQIKEVFPQGMIECLTHCSNSIGEGFHGQGEWDLIELQDQKTEAKSMKMNSMLLDSTQPLLVRDGYIDTENLENKFGLIVPVSDLPKDVNLKTDLMTRVEAGRPPTEAYQLGQEIGGEMNHRAGVFSTNSDMPDMEALGTATGIDAITEHAVGRRGPALQLYAQMQVDQAYQKLELRQKYWCKKMYEPIAKDLGGDAVKWFMECNIRQDISIAVVPGSWMPQTDRQKKEGMTNFLNIAGQIIAAKGDPKMMDDILRKTNDLFGGGMDFNDYETQSIEAQLRLDKLRDVATFAEAQFGEFLYDPETGNISSEALMETYAGTAQLLKISYEPTDEKDIFATLPLDVMLDDHTEFINAYSDWLTTPDGRAASLFVRTLVHQLADYHEQAIAFKAYKLKQYENLTQIPDLQAQLIANAANASQQKDFAEADAANQPPVPEEPAAPPPMAEADKMAMQHEQKKELKQMDIDAKAQMPPPQAGGKVERMTAAG